MYTRTPAFIQRYEQNPVLSCKDVPYETGLVFNAGVAKWDNQYVMIFRNDLADMQTQTLHQGHTNLGIAWSPDGKQWEVPDTPFLSQEQAREKCRAFHEPRFGDQEIKRVYDPRITVLGDAAYLCFAADTPHGICGGVADLGDFDRFDVLSLSAPDNRNMVLFPEKINGKWARLERPFPIYGRPGPENFDIWYSESPDGIHWGRNRLVLGSEEVPYVNNKIGPAAPPVKTEKGWLTTFHGVYKDEETPLNAWHENWFKTYYAGLMLLDLERPWKVIGMMKEPLLVPETEHELKGFRGSVIFPGGMISEPDGTVNIYYGAADTVECLANAHVDDLLSQCTPLA